MVSQTVKGTVVVFVLENILKVFQKNLKKVLGAFYGKLLKVLA